MRSPAHETDSGLIQQVADQLVHFGSSRQFLLPILQMIQSLCGYLPPESMDMAARHLALAPCDVYGVATFYNQFRFTPPGKNTIRICLGTACHVRGGGAMLEAFERTLDIEEGHTTPDRHFSIERTACVGCCALAPVVTVADHVHGNMAFNKVELLLEKYREPF